MPPRRCVPCILDLDVLVQICVCALKSVSHLSHGSEAYTKGAREAWVMLHEKRADALVVIHVRARAGVSALLECAQPTQ